MAEQNRHKLLVVDDSSTIRNLVKVSFEQENFEIFEAGDGMEALSKVAEVKPDLLLLDVTMPKLDGMETLQILRESNSTKGLPVILITALGDTDTVLQAKNLGISDYIVKPFNRTTLLEKVKKAAEGVLKEKAVQERGKMDGALQELRRQLAETPSPSAQQEVTKEEVEAVQAQASSSVLAPCIVGGYEVEEIPLNQIQAGQVLALPVSFKNKATFLKEGTVLNEKFIEKLKEKENDLEKKAVTIRKEKILRETSKAVHNPPQTP